MQSDSFEHRRRKLTEASLSALNMSTSRVSGQAFFNTLVEQMAKALEVEFVIAGKVAKDNGKDVIQTIAVWAGNALADNISYPLEGTPCENVSCQEMCFHPKGIQQDYPDDRLLVEMGAESYIGMPMISTAGLTLGILVALDTRPMTELTHYHALSLLSIFASRCSAELEHQQRNEQLTKLVEQRTEELMQAHQQLKAQQHLASLGATVAGVSHQINTPIGVSVTAISYMQEQFRELLNGLDRPDMDPEQFKQVLTGLSNACDDLARNVHRSVEIIEHFKQLAMDEETGESRVLQLKKHLEVIVDTQLYRLQELGLSYDIDCPADVKIKTRASLLNHIFTNLLANTCTHGFKQVSPDGHIKIKVWREGKRLAIRYLDNGQGVSPEQLPHLFEPFYTTERNQGRLGLGLNIVFNAVSKLKGQIQANRRQGLEFLIYLPLSGATDS